MAVRNAKTRAASDPYEVWQAPGWTWNVLKFYSNDLTDPYARVFCKVTSPFVPEGELGDVYYSEIKGHAELTYRDPEMVTA